MEEPSEQSDDPDGEQGRPAFGAFLSPLRGSDAMGAGSGGSLRSPPANVAPALRASGASRLAAGCCSPCFPLPTAGNSTAATRRGSAIGVQRRRVMLQESAPIAPSPVSLSSLQCGGEPKIQNPRMSCRSLRSAICNPPFEFPHGPEPVEGQSAMGCGRSPRRDLRPATCDLPLPSSPFPSDLRRLTCDLLLPPSSTPYSLLPTPFFKRSA